MTHGLFNHSRFEQNTPRWPNGSNLSIWQLICCAIPLALSNAVFAQEAVGGEAATSSASKKMTLVPRVTVTETLTDNVSLSANGRQSDMITEISPGIRVTQSVGRVRGLLDYSLNGRVYTSGTSATSIQQTLTSLATAELIEGRAFVEVAAGIGQQAISVSKAQSSATGVQNANLSETSNFRVAPYLKGSLGGGVDYDVRYSLTNSRSNGVASAESSTTGLSFAIAGKPSGGKLGWSANASSNTNSFAGGRTTESDVVSGGLTYSIVPQLVANASLGQENTNVSSVGKIANWTNILGISWNPTPSTTASLSRTNRPFGDTHSIGFSHRTAKTAWQYSDNQDVTNTPSQSGFGSLGNVYDLFYAQFASIEPDPIKRAALVEGYLQTNGINPKANVLGGFLTSAVAIQRRQNLSLALLGVRSTVTFLVSRSVSSRLDTVSTAIDDLSNGSVVEQNGFSINLGHRLTPESALNWIVSSQRSTSTGLAQDNASYQTSVGFSTKLGQRATASFNARRAVFESSTVPYQENAVSGTLSVQF